MAATFSYTAYLGFVFSKVMWTTFVLKPEKMRETEIHRNHCLLHKSKVKLFLTTFYKDRLNVGWLLYIGNVFLLFLFYVIAKVFYVTLVLRIIIKTCFTCDD